MSRPSAARLAVAAVLLGVGVAQWELLTRMLGTAPFFDEGTYLLSVADLRHGFALGEDVFASQPPLFYDLLRGLANVFDPTLRGLRQATTATTLLVIPASFLLGRVLVGRDFEIAFNSRGFRDTLVCPYDLVYIFGVHRAAHAFFRQLGV